MLTPHATDTGYSNAQLLLRWRDYSGCPHVRRPRHTGDAQMRILPHSFRKLSRAAYLRRYMLAKGWSGTAYDHAKFEPNDSIEMLKQTLAEDKWSSDSTGYAITFPDWLVPPSYAPADR